MGWRGENAQTQTPEGTVDSGDEAQRTGRLIVLVGGSSTGKSTLARKLQEELLPEQWMHFSTDTVLYCLPQSIVDAANFHNDWSQVHAPSVRRTTLSCLRTILDEGYCVIYDCVVPTEPAAKELAVALRGYRPLLIGLTCSWEEIERRTLARGDRTLEEARRGYRAADEYLTLDRVIDTSSEDPLIVARAVLEALKNGPGEAWRRNLLRLGLSA